ncbi:MULTISPECIES: hypothetical protein [Bacteroides]|jgi:hypothetical protein|uniref:hypothetical protein n=2 Tax=Bacteroides TaxID=816 RepID=UPI0004B4EE7A|nr:hypothetical protein [Bacteroides neonati]
MMQQSVNRSHSWADEELCNLNRRAKLILLLSLFTLLVSLFLFCFVSFAYRIGAEEGDYKARMELIEQLGLQSNDSLYQLIITRESDVPLIDRKKN